ncbi:hypothetical protein Hanom_Chr16g01505771 [Helianthus anomalus]
MLNNCDNAIFFLHLRFYIFSILCLRDRYKQVMPVLCGRWLHILFVKGLPHFLLVMKLCFLVYNL